MRVFAVTVLSSCWLRAVWTGHIDSAKQPYGSKIRPLFSMG
jgi:hypothetical protein